MLPGKNKEEKIENFNLLVKGESNGLINHTENFITNLQNGIFTEIFQREKELREKLSKFYYEEKLVKNMEIHFKNQKQVLLKKRKPNALKKLQEELYLLNENDSTKTLTDKEEESEEESEHQSHISSKSKSNKVINTTRKSDSSIRISKPQKNVVTVNKSSPEWVKKFRAQEAERYRYPLKPWEYILIDGSK